MYLVNDSFMYYKHIRRGQQVSISKKKVGFETLCLEEDSPTDLKEMNIQLFFKKIFFMAIIHLSISLKNSI